MVICRLAFNKEKKSLSSENFIDLKGILRNLDMDIQRIMIIEVDILSCHRVINVTEQLLLYVSLSFKQKHDWWLQQYNHNVLANFII